MKKLILMITLLGSAAAFAGPFNTRISYKLGGFESQASAVEAAVASVDALEMGQFPDTHLFHIGDEDNCKDPNSMMTQVETARKLRANGKVGYVTIDPGTSYDRNGNASNSVWVTAVIPCIEKD